MTTPYTVNWVAPNPGAIATVPSAAYGTGVFQVPLNGQAYTDLRGITAPVFSMPSGNARNVTITITAGTFSSIEVIGTSLGTNQIVKETQTPGGGFSSVVPYVGTYYYGNITGISMQPTTGTFAFTVGYGTNGYTQFFQGDVFNAHAQYTVSYNNVVGTVEMNPYYTQTYSSFVNGSIVYTDVHDSTLFFDNFFPVDYYPNYTTVIPNTIFSPANATGPFSAAASISWSGIPLQAITTYIWPATTGSFTQTILQQGGRY